MDFFILLYRFFLLDFNKKLLYNIYIKNEIKETLIMANIIRVTEEDRNAVQRANVDSASLANLITYMISNNIDVSNERFQEYEKRYQEAFNRFELEKTKIEKKYLKGLNVASWTLDYESCEITYNV